MIEVPEKVLTYFKNDRFRAELWMTTLNPLLGGMTPKQMIDMGRSEKLQEFIDRAMS